MNAVNREWRMENGKSVQLRAFAYSLFPIPYSRLAEQAHV